MTGYVCHQYGKHHVGTPRIRTVMRLQISTSAQNGGRRLTFHVVARSRSWTCATRCSPETAFEEIKMPPGSRFRRFPQGAFGTAWVHGH